MRRKPSAARSATTATCPSRRGRPRACISSTPSAQRMHPVRPSRAHPLRGPFFHPMCGLLTDALGRAFPSAVGAEVIDVNETDERGAHPPLAPIARETSRIFLTFAVCHPYAQVVRRQHLVRLFFPRSAVLGGTISTCSEALRAMRVTATLAVGPEASDSTAAASR